VWRAHVCVSVSEAVCVFACYMRVSVACACVRAMCVTVCG